MAFQLLHVADEIWCVRRPSYFTCSYIVKTPARIVLVDAGMDSTGRDMIDALSTLGFDVTCVVGILLTHWHNDHAAGAKVVKDLSKAATYHQLEEPYLTRKTAHSGLRGYLADRVPEMGPLVLFKGLIGEASPLAVEATQFIKHGDLLFDEFEVIETPGHRRACQLL